MHETSLQNVNTIIEILEEKLEKAYENNDLKEFDDIFIQLKDAVIMKAEIEHFWKRNCIIDNLKRKKEEAE